MMIIAAIAYNSFTDDKIRKIILSGANVLRFNLSYGSVEQNIEYINNARKIIDDLNSQVKILLDLPSKKVRLGDFEVKSFAVHEDENLVMKSANYTANCQEFIPVDIAKIGDATYVNQTITIGDGEIACQVIEIIDPDTIKVKILNNGIIQAMKALNLRYVGDNTKLLDRYREFSKIISACYPELVAIPYIDCQLAGQMIDILKNDSPIFNTVIKIENQNGITDFEKICSNKETDYILLDRGELGINISYEKIGVAQKEIMKMAKQHGKPIIISTQILESVINNYIPTKSDVVDLTSIVLDGANGIMFCKETGVGNRPAYVISVARKIILETEKYMHNNYVIQ